MKINIKKKKKKIFYTLFKIAWEKKMNTGDVLIQFHHSIENDRKLYYTEKFSIKRILNTFEHSVAYENKRVSGATAESLLIGIYLKYFWGKKKTRDRNHTWF